MMIAVRRPAVLQHRRVPIRLWMLLLTNSNINHGYMSPTRLKKILVSCYLEREQLDRLRQLSDKTGAPMTHYMREGIALVLEKHAVRIKTPKSKP
jgi:hypothetical protein